MIKSKENGLVGGALALTLSVFVVKVIGYIYKLPLSYILGDEGMGYFNSAYSVFGFFYMISLGGVPRAITICVTEARVKYGSGAVNKILGISLKLFLSVGIFFAIVLMIFSGFFAKIIGNSTAKFSLFCIAPSLTFVSASGVLRGYLNGMMRVKEIAIAEVLDGVSKFVTGLALALFAVRKNAPVQIISAYTVLGVSIGAFIGSSFMFVCAKIKKTEENTEQKSEYEISCGEILRKIFKISVPITLSSAVMGITNIIDLGLIMQRLKIAGFSEQEAVALYGNFTTLVVPLLSLVSAFVTPIATASISHITSKLACGKRNEYYTLLKQILFLTSVIVLPIAFAYFFFSEEILKLLFSDTSAVIATPMLMIAAPSVFFSAMLVMSNTVLEASGLASAPLVSVGIGSVVKIFLAYILIGRIGILGAPISTVFCYFVSFIISSIIMRVRLRLKISIFALSFVPLVVLLLLFTAGKRFYESFIRDNENALNFMVFSAVMALIYLIFVVIFLRKRLNELTYYVEIAKNSCDTL